MKSDIRITPDGMIELSEPVHLPELLDVLIVGGGPAGTAAAFRCRELGMAALVVDYDDLMKRIRDYAKDKLILPHFGGGDQMRFPAGGDLISALRFDPIDKDDMCGRWKSLYHANSVPAQVGVELTGIDRAPDGSIVARAWNHRSGKEVLYRTRHLVLSIGRGVPRRFDIPGNTDGITYRLEDAVAYTGHPVCVIGGGTSAAEAVIAISDAKRMADDACPVYWSYRGDRMPKVSKALSEVFFNAYLGNGNIRYYPNSEPVAIVTGPDRHEYLSIRVDRRTIEGRSIETTHLEFLKGQCIACIGEDIPEGFLGSLGIELATYGPKNKKRMVVTQLLETRQPGVYLIGDILSPAYLEADDHEADPSTFREIRHPGNIKSALRDGVLVAEIIKQKLEGRSQIDVELAFSEEEEDVPTMNHVVSASKSFIQSSTQTTVSDGHVDLVDVVQAPRLIRITPAGLDEDEYPLNLNGGTTIGRTGSDIAFPQEPSIADRHAAVYMKNGDFYVHDGGGKTGTFFRLRAGEQTPLANGDLLHLGRQFLVFILNENACRIMQYDYNGTLVQQRPLSEGTIVVGRDKADVILDAEDAILSRRHLAITLEGGRLFAKDLNSLNHTYLRIRKEYPIRHDDVIRLGQFLFRLSTHENMQPDKVSVILKPEAAPPPQPSRPVDAPSPQSQPGGPSILFHGHGSTVSVNPSETILSVAKKHDIPINYECESGRCGFDPVRILSGSEHLNELDEDEEGWTLENVCHLEPGKHRLACMLKTTGPVVVEVVEKQ